MRCDQYPLLVNSIVIQVSIPAGFSDALRHRCHHVVIFGCVVSIPAGFSDALRLVANDPKYERWVLFQSLLGFLMRCDSFLDSAISNNSVFQSLLGFLMRCDSIPSPFLRISSMFQSLLGFLMRCDVTTSSMSMVSPKFQSLLGFLMRCDTLLSSRLHPSICFNPCWVF